MKLNVDEYRIVQRRRNSPRLKYIEMKSKLFLGKKPWVIIIVLKCLLNVQ